MQFHILLLHYRGVGLHLALLTLSQLSFFLIFSFHFCHAHVLISRFFSLLPFHTAFYFPKSMSLHIPHPAVIHIVYSSLKDSPCVMQAVSPPSHFISLPFPSLFCPPLLPQNVWIDLNGVIVTALPAVCPSTSASQRLWKVWREQRERKKGKGRERKRERGKFFWTTRHGGPPESQV